ncbi:MAG: Tfp pilus assembly protein FimT/FimU [Polyangiales bacterium]
MTLLELMAVITLIGIFSAVAFPSLGGALRQRHAAAYAREVFGSFQVARSRAAATGAAHAVFFVAASNGFYIRMGIDTNNGPSSSCVTGSSGTARPWAANPLGPITLGDNQLVGAVSTLLNDPQNPNNNDYTSDPLTILPTGASPVSAVCYTPSGSVFSMLSGATGTWNRGIPVDPAGTGWSIALTSQGSAATVYQIVIGPNGLPNFVVQ